VKHPVYFNRQCLKQGFIPSFLISAYYIFHSFLAKRLTRFYVFY